MCCNEFVFFDLSWHTRDQLSKWSYTNNEYWKSALFKFVTISQTGIFNAVRITDSIKCVWYWLSTGIAHIWKQHQFQISSRVYYCNSNMGFKIFDSHVRDLYGRGQPKGTCVVLEVLSPDSLVHYFQSRFRELKWEEYKLRIFKIGWFLKTVWMKPWTSI